MRFPLLRISYVRRLGRGSGVQTPSSFTPSFRPPSRTGIGAIVHSHSVDNLVSQGWLGTLRFRQRQRLGWWCFRRFVGGEGAGLTRSWWGWFRRSLFGSRRLEAGILISISAQRILNGRLRPLDLSWLYRGDLRRRLFIDCGLNRSGRGRFFFAGGDEATAILVGDLVALRALLFLPQQESNAERQDCQEHPH